MSELRSRGGVVGSYFIPAALCLGGWGGGQHVDYIYSETIMSKRLVLDQIFLTL